MRSGPIEGDGGGTVAQRAAVHAALGEPHRLAVVDELARSDRAPIELARLLDLPSNLLAHHLDVLEDAGVIERFGSSGDRRRRYVRLRRAIVRDLGIAPHRPVGPVLFVCTHNSARSQLAAALWRDRTGGVADSAGAAPAPHVHPQAVAAARRAGLDLTDATPRALPAHIDAEVVITVCDRAHEQLRSAPEWWHWSIPDPADTPPADHAPPADHTSLADHTAFDAVIAELDDRITWLRPQPPAQRSAPHHAATPTPS